MARLEPLVGGGPKRRFALSSASTDSMFPAHLVPAGQLGPAPHPPIYLQGLAGSPMRVVGTYRTTLQFPECCVPFTLNAVNAPRAGGVVGVLGMDFMREYRIHLGSFDFGANRVLLTVGGRQIWVAMAEQDNLDSNVVFIPTVRRVQQPEQDLEETLSIVMVDVETTGFGGDAEVIQLAAKWKGMAFSVHILPRGNVQPKASEVNGLLKRGDELFHAGERVATTPVRVALKGFFSWLRSTGAKAVLVAHNAFGFDANVILRLVASEGLTGEMDAVAVGFSDTLPLFKQHLPGRLAAGKRFTLKALANDLLSDCKYTLHEALEDVKVLEKLVERTGVTSWHLIGAMKPLDKFSAFKNTST